MKRVGRTSLLVAGLFLLFGFCIEISPAQENTGSPSERTKEAVQRLTQTPARIGKGIDALNEAANSKLKQMLGGKPGRATRSDNEGLSGLPKSNSAPEPARYSPKAKRDPFRPPSLQSRTRPSERANLSPLERFELGQLVLVGIVWDVQEPRAIIEDNTGLGYVVKVGTPIGRNEGSVRSIHPSHVIVEELLKDLSGMKKKREVTMKLLAN